MPDVYTAFAQEIPLAMSRRLSASIRAGWQPDYEAARQVTSKGKPVDVVARSMQAEDLDEPTGRGEPTRVPVKYVLAWPDDSF